MPTGPKGLKPSDRLAAIFRAISRGDDSVAGAILSDDRFLASFLTERESDLAHVERTGKLLQSFQRSCANQAIVAGGVPRIQADGGVRGAPGPTPVARSISPAARAAMFASR